MKTFSQRKGLEPVSEVLQLQSMSDALRNSLWNALDTHIWSVPGFVFDRNTGAIGAISTFSYELWDLHFKRPVDDRPNLGREVMNEIRRYFFGCTWNQVYDLLEFIVDTFGAAFKHLEAGVNRVLERELSGYRFVDGVLVDITDEQELEALREAMVDTRFAVVTDHFRRATELMSDRNSPDYRNSIKESISAVEAMARIASGDERATLGAALKVLERQGQLHQALKEGYSKLYGYANDGDGIRHAMLEKSNLDQSDAKYFLLSCIAFTNYLKANLP